MPGRMPASAQPQQKLLQRSGKDARQDQRATSGLGFSARSRSQKPRSFYRGAPRIGPEQPLSVQAGYLGPYELGTSATRSTLFGDRAFCEQLLHVSRPGDG